MKIVLILIGMITTTTALQAQKPEAIKTKKETVINQKMIEKFKNAEYPENAINYSALMTNYEFEDVKLIIQAYQAGKVDLKTENIEKYLAETKEILNKPPYIKDSIDKKYFIAQKK